jgi:hypothetical protein
MGHYRLSKKEVLDEKILNGKFIFYKTQYSILNA